MKADSKIQVLLVLLILLAVNSLSAAALGIRSPAGKEIDFEPGYTVTYDFAITSTSRDVKISPGGYHPEYVTLSRDYIEGDDPDKSFKVTVTLPDAPAEPGHHLIWIRADETNVGKTGTGGAFVLSGGTYIKLHVLHKQPFIEAKFNVPSVNKGDILTSSFNVRNFGEAYISNIRGSVDIFDAGGDKIDSLMTNSVGLDSWEGAGLTARRNTSDMSLGLYTAKAKLFWHTNVTEFEQDFNIGGELVKINNFTRQYKADTINKVHIQAENLGNIKLNNVRANIEYTDIFEKRAGDTVSTPSYEVPPWSEITMEGFWDATDVEPGEYTANIVASFDGGSVSISAPVNVTKAASTEFALPALSTVAILNSLLIIFLLLLLAGSFIYLLITHKKRR